MRYGRNRTNQTRNGGSECSYLGTCHIHPLEIIGIDGYGASAITQPACYAEYFSATIAKRASNSDRAHDAPTSDLLWRVHPKEVAAAPVFAVNPLDIARDWPLSP